VPGVCKLTANSLIEVRFNNCKLTANSALMILLSLATSAAYFGCTHATKRPLQTCIPKRPVETAIRDSPPYADKVVQIPRIVELWRESKELEDRRLLCGRDGNVNEMIMLARLRTASGDSHRPDTSGTNPSESPLPCALQVRGFCALMRCSCHSIGCTASKLAWEISVSSFPCHILTFSLSVCRSQPPPPLPLLRPTRPMRAWEPRLSERNEAQAADYALCPCLQLRGRRED
jgi:hypothetical protein